MMDDGFGHYDSNRPVGVFYIRIEYPGVDAVITQPTCAALACQHVANHCVVDCVGRFRHDIEYVLFQHTRLIRMNQVSAVAVDNEAVRLFLETFLESLMVLCIYTLMPESEPFQRYVGSQQTHLTALLVVNMGGIGCSELL